MVDDPFNKVTPVTVFRAGLRKKGWRWMGDLYWNGQDAGWHFCRDHWYLSYHLSLFQELRDMPSWIS